MDCVSHLELGVGSACCFKSLQKCTQTVFDSENLKLLVSAHSCSLFKHRCRCLSIICIRILHVISTAFKLYECALVRQTQKDGSQSKVHRYNVCCQLLTTLVGWAV